MVGVLVSYLAPGDSLSFKNQFYCQAQTVSRGTEEFVKHMDKLFGMRNSIIEQKKHGLWSRADLIYILDCHLLACNLGSTFFICLRFHFLICETGTK